MTYACHMTTKRNVPWGSIVGFIAIAFGLASQLFIIFWIGLIVVIADPIIETVNRNRAQKDEMIQLLREQNARHTN